MNADLRATFDAYVAAERAASRVFVSYKFGDATEAEVHRLQRAERAAFDAHLAVINAEVTL